MDKQTATNRKLQTYNNSAEPFLSVIVQFLLLIGISIRNSDSGLRVYRVTLSGGGGSTLPPLLLVLVELDISLLEVLCL